MANFEDDSPVVRKIYSGKPKKSKLKCPFCDSVLTVRKVSKITADGSHIDDLEFSCESCKRENVDV